MPLPLMVYQLLMEVPDQGGRVHRGVGGRDAAACEGSKDTWLRGVGC